MKLADRLRTGEPARERFKQQLAKLPMGNTVVIPTLAFALALISPTRRRTLLDNVMRKLRISDPKQRRYKIETAKIRKVCKRTTPDPVIVPYDLSVSAPGFGEIYYSTMLARYFSLHNKCVHFVFITDSFRTDFQSLHSKKEIADWVEQLTEIPRILLDKNCDQVSMMNWREFVVFREQHSQATAPYMPFEDEVLARNPFYHHSFNLTNHLMATATSELLGQFLVTADELLERVDITLPAAPYVTWHARHTRKWNPDRDLTENEFVAIHARLKTQYPQHSIMIVSDATGCAHFKELANKHDVKCLFSKDYSGSFMGDAALVLASSYFFLLRGGGMNAVSLFSNLPYEIIAAPANESVWSVGKFTSWATDKQHFKRLDWGDQSLYLPSPPTAQSA